jgi:hypothetical protein
VYGSKWIHIDRHEQLKLISDLVDRDDDDSSVVLVRAPEQMGKSAFLLEVSQRLRGKAAIAVADLADHPTIDDVLDVLAEQLQDEGLQLPRFVAAREADSTTTNAPIFKDLWLRRSKLTVILDSMYNSERQCRALLRCIVDDLCEQTNQKKLILIDSHDRAGDELQRWIRGWFIHQLRRVPGLVAVLAGRDFPILPAPNNLVCLELAPFNLDHVVEWLVTLAATYSDTEMRTIAHVLCLEHDGKPGRIDGVIQTLKKQGWVP